MLMQPPGRVCVAAVHLQSTHLWLHMHFCFKQRHPMIHVIHDYTMA